MKRLVLISVFMALASPTWGASNGRYTEYNYNCQEYLDAYAKTTLIDDNKYSGPHAMWEASGYIRGYTTAYNRETNNGIGNILEDMSMRDTYSWIASWCRDNPSKTLDDALQALY